MRARRLRSRSETAMTWSRSSERIVPVLPPESVEAEIAEISEKPARMRDWITVGAPVPPPMVTIFDTRVMIQD